MPSLTKDIKNITFWAREFGIPLFWLTDKNHKIISSLDNLVFFKGTVFHCYHLNDAQARAAKRGFRLFSQKNSAVRYAQQAKLIIEEFKKVVDQYQAVKHPSFGNAELKRRFLALLRLLDRYSNLYTQTEAIYVEQLGNKPALKKTVDRLGKIRLTLRQAGEPVFYILLGQLLKQISKRFSIRSSDLFFYTHDELLNLFAEKKVRLATLEKRRRGFALITIRGQQMLVTGNKFKKLYAKITAVEKKGTLSGRTAVPGLVRGRARLILHNRRRITRQVAAFKKGEILITEMTRPDTIAACRKSAAIITDEGGITSHAAVIAREFKIPCIVGVSQATQVIRTGDFIEVNATEGVVKILKKLV
ncbi:hypothetical protein KKC47_01120 [Patescibacteria group bacterium]|nr:hypothetical protein [Patescibacteria group bacterium]